MTEKKGSPKILTTPSGKFSYFSIKDFNHNGYDIEKLSRGLREKQKLESAEIVDLSIKRVRETTKS